MQNGISVFYDSTNRPLRSYIDKNGVLQVNAEDAAYGLKYVVVLKNGVERVNWEDVRSILKETGYTEKVGADSYIPESMFYLLAMRADSPAAREFQNWAATSVFPSIRRQGYYAVANKLDKWTMIRELGKEVRKAMTDAACRFYDYSRQFGDRRTKGMIIGQWTNEGYAVSGIQKGGRDDADHTTIEQLAATILIEGTQRDNTISGIAQKKSPRQIESSNSRKLQKLAAGLLDNLKKSHLLK